MSQAIEINDLTVVFNTRQGKVRALDKLSLCVEAGCVFGFLGPNGAGKTTTMHVLLGFIGASEGRACIFGTDVRESIARQRIGFLPEHPDTYRFLTGRELLKMTGKLFVMPRNVLSPRIDELLGQVGMRDAADRRIATYSRGMMQRICLAQALVNDPDLVILDEPTGGLDLSVAWISGGSLPTSGSVARRCSSPRTNCRKWSSSATASRFLQEAVS